MIARLTGAIVRREEHSVIIDTGGVGYRVFTTTHTIDSLPRERAALWTHLSVRENALELFGFSGEDELDFFTKLISVSGIGPRSALAIMSLAPVPILARAVASGDTSYLTKVAGIGKKSAEKIVLELRDKIIAIGVSDDPLPNNDALDALSALGYPLPDAREALQKIDATVTDTGERVKAALRRLNR
jgi:Holliday junction DNA helicase RuvA